jgi:hypothetical protein
MVHTMLMILKVTKGLFKVFMADSKERERERERVSVCVRERERVSVCVRERERERAYYKISIAFPEIPILPLPSIS